MTLPTQARALTIPHADQPMEAAELRDRLEAVTNLCWKMADEIDQLKRKTADLLVSIVTPEMLEAAAEATDALVPNDPNPEMQTVFRDGARKMREAAESAKEADHAEY